MDRGVRITLALSVVLVGVGTAMLFRHQGTSADRTPPEFVEPPLVLRDTSSSPAAGALVRDFPQMPKFSTGTPSAGWEKPATVVVPARMEGPPPSLPRTYPGADQGSWGTPMTLGPASASPPAKLLRHKITDGDTLPALAQRYLGAKDRYLEIFELNRDVLKNPELLPIGRQLKIPFRERE